MRKWFELVFWLLMLVLLAVFVSSFGSEAKAQDDQFGRTTEEVVLRTNPSGAEVEELFVGQEFKVFGSRNDWYQVVTAHGDTGWLPADSIELAVEGDEAVRRYADGFCYATPAIARRNTEAGLLSRWQHELLFADTVELPRDGEEALVFQGQAIRVDRQYRIAETSPVVIELNAFWVSRHPSLSDLGRIGWQHTAAWQLIYECEAEE